jgi:SSS family solute:Na+ symporter
MRLSTLDLVILALYCITIISIGLWVSREKEGHKKNTKDYFLASSALPWWAVGASLIASNISAEQIIGMSGSGYAIGLGIASYEWMAAITLIIVGKYFLPIFLQKGIYTMPQFLEERYDHRVRVVMAFFWLGVYIFVNLTSVLYLGALAISTIAGLSLFNSMVLLAAFAVTYSLYGGLKAVALTDLIQVVLLIMGGLFVSYLALDRISGGEGFWQGFQLLTEAAPEKFDMILSPDHPHYIDLPGLSVLLGGMWIMNLSYWGFNQYITQRALAAKSLTEARKGIAFAAFLKLLMPLIVVLPGLAAVMLVPDLSKPDQAYPAMMALLPSGVLGLTFAALIAAIVSSLGSMSNSISTIFTMDIYKSVLSRGDASERKLVMIGRITSFVSLLIAVIIAEPLLGKMDQAFQYIQEFTGFFTPGIVAIFLLGFFWKKTTANAALTAAIGSAVLSLLLKIFWPSLPFMDRVGLVFVLCCLLAVLVVMIEGAGVHAKAIDLKRVEFATTRSYNISALAVTLILAALYVSWW